jgi:hypothetical protein
MQGNPAKGGVVGQSLALHLAETKKAGMNPAFVCLRDYLEEKLPK